MKAFDMVNHEILLRKLFRYGIRGIPLSLFTSYLGNRTQRVKVGSSLSSARTIFLWGTPGQCIGASVVFDVYK